MQTCWAVCTFIQTFRPILKSGESPKGAEERNSSCCFKRACFCCTSSLNAHRRKRRDSFHAHQYDPTHIRTYVRTYTSNYNSYYTELLEDTVTHWLTGPAIPRLPMAPPPMPSLLAPLKPPPRAAHTQTHTTTCNYITWEDQAV